MKTRLLIITIIIGIAGFTVIPHSYAGCIATIIPEPCFDSFSMSHTSLNEKSIMEQYARNIEMNFGDWEIPNRGWSAEEIQLNLPATLCTEFISDGQTHYRMAKWVDPHKISSWENHYNPLLCDKWLQPIDDGIKLKLDKELYSSEDVAQIQVIDKEMNLDPTIIDSFDIHVFSDTDHTGIQLAVTETESDTGYFYGDVVLTTKDESSGVRLLVEDAIWVDYKMNRIFSKVINEQRDSYELEITSESDITTCNVIHIPIINYALDDCEDMESFKITLIFLIIIIPILIIILFKYKRKF